MIIKATDKITSGELPPLPTLDISAIPKKDFYTLYEIHQGKYHRFVRDGADTWYCIEDRVVDGHAYITVETKSPNSIFYKCIANSSSMTSSNDNCLLTWVHDGKDWELTPSIHDLADEGDFDTEFNEDYYKKFEGQADDSTEEIIYSEELNTSNNILIDVVRISGFRGISELEIHLPRVAVLIGTNNSGKTSVIKAIQLALGESRFLADEDFHIDSDDQKYSEILVDVRIVPTDDKGVRQIAFHEAWAEVFQDKIQADASGHQYFAMRTRCIPDVGKGGFSVERFGLSEWVALSNWKSVKVLPRSKILNRFNEIPFISIDAQRDIHQELKEKSSFVGKILSSIQFEEQDTKDIEAQISQINSNAVEKSDALKTLKSHLNTLNQSFTNKGVTELTPLPKKVRDLSKGFNVNYGETENNSFSMEYHGMGTRSWASMLTVKAFTGLMAERSSNEFKSYFPVLAAEEPEAHLHPNAQRTLYKQLIDSSGQVIISTHSPYLAALADPSELRFLSRNTSSIIVSQLSKSSDPEDDRKLHREVIHTRGELLFSKILVLSEGETEAQALPDLFYRYVGVEPFSLGVNFIGVNGSGARYYPFLRFAKDVGVPVFIFSDGEIITKRDLKIYYEKVFGTTDIDNANNITILDNTDFEGYLFNSGFKSQIESAIQNVDGPEHIDFVIHKKHGTLLKAKPSDLPPCITCKQPILVKEFRDYSGPEGRLKAMKEIIDSKKPKYAQAITEELSKLDADKLPSKLIDFFDKIMIEVSK